MDGLKRLLGTVGHNLKTNARGAVYQVNPFDGGKSFVDAWAPPPQHYPPNHVLKLLPKLNFNPNQTIPEARLWNGNPRNNPLPVIPRFQPAVPMSGNGLSEELPEGLMFGQPNVQLRGR